MAQVNPPEDPIAALCDSTRLMRGLRATIEPNWERLTASEVAPILLGVSREGIDKTVRTEVMQLEDFIEQSVEPNAKAIYLDALEELNIIFLVVRRYLHDGREHGSVTMSWLATVNSEFVDLLYARDQTALVLLAYYAVLLKQVEYSWWLRGWSKWTLDCVLSQLSESRMKWVEWPRSHIYSSE